MHPDIARQYLLLATDLAQTHSKDRSTRVGAYLVHPILLAERSRGYNGLPRGARDELDERHERPLKYEYFEHAETNAIVSYRPPNPDASRPCSGGGFFLLLTSTAPCAA